MTNARKLNDIVADIDWENYEFTIEEQEQGSPEHWDVCEVLFNKLEYLKQYVELSAGDESVEEHIESIRCAQTILGMLNEEKLRRAIK
jgi:hypothetical protein